MKIFLNELLQAIEIIDIKNEKDTYIENIEYNSKKVTKGCLFVCIKGFKSDGHKYILEAIQKGAVAVIVEDFQENYDIMQIRVKNSRHALAALAAAFYGNPSSKMNMIGITATNGKTTTSFMIDSILEKNSYKTGLIGTVRIKFGDVSVPAKLTTPDSLDLQRYLSEMNEQNISHVTMEVSSAALALNRVDEVDFDVVSLHNISREHIDLHGSFEEYFNCKASLIKNAKQNKWAILNLDCPYSASLVNATKAKTITFGVEKSTGDFLCKNLDLSTGRPKFTVEMLKSVKGLEHVPHDFDIELSVSGYHSVYNSMVAIIVALIYKVPVEIIQESLKNFVGVERRFEFVYEDDFKIVDDHFANTGNIDVTMKTLNFMKFEKLHLVYAIRGSRGVTVNKENALTIAKWADELGIKEITATLSKSLVTEKDIVQKEEKEVFEKVMLEAGIKVNLFEQLPDAIEHELSCVETGDVILLAGCQGMDLGAEIALNQLYKLRPYLSKDELFSSIINREIALDKTINS